MPITTSEEFLAILERSNLLTDAELADAREISQEIPDATQFAKTLAREQFLTFWQAGHLLAGRSDFFLGKYKLIKLLGRGGMGSVFLAEHVMMHRRVALKILPRTFAKNPAALEHFLAEARIIASLDHSNVVSAYSVDTEGGRHYLVMEYVDGLDLQRVVEANGPLDCISAVDCIRQAADGLAHAHARNMVHCDIKPSNLILNEQGIVKILDMGLARLVGREKPENADSSDAEKQILGSVDYLAPEQALASADFDHRADLYSLGCTMYFLLLGHPPFPSGTLAQRIVKHQTVIPPEITRERPDVPENLAAICRKMMAKSPADRYQTAAEVSDALGAWRPEVPQPEKKPIAIKKIAKPPEELRPSTPWEMDFGDELKNIAATSGVNEFNLPPGKSGKMAAVKNGSSPGTLGNFFAGTRTRLIFTSCIVAILLVFFIAGVILSIVFQGNRNGAGGKESTPVESQDKQEQAEPTTVKPPPPPSPAPIENPPAVIPGSQTPPAVQEDSSKNAPNPTGLPPGIVRPELQPAQVETPVTNPPVEIPPPTDSAPPADPFKRVVTSVDLPDSGFVLLGKVLPIGDAKLKIELVGGESAGKAKFALQEDPHAVGGQAWNIFRSDPRIKDKDTLVARLKFKGSNMSFEWTQNAAGPNNTLRNCGIVLTAGEAGKFVQFRVPKGIQALDLYLENDETPVKVPFENPADAGVLQMKIQELKEPFLENNISEKTLQGRKYEEVTFTNPDYEAFSLQFFYDLNSKNEMVVRYAAAISPLPLFKKLPATAFRISTVENSVSENRKDTEKYVKTRDRMPDANPNKAALVQKIADVEKSLKQLNAITELAKKIDAQKIHYRIVADYGNHQVVFFDSSLPPPKEEAVKPAAPQERPLKKKSKNGE